MIELKKLVGAYKKVGFHKEDFDMSVVNDGQPLLELKTQSLETIQSHGKEFIAKGLQPYDAAKQKLAPQANGAADHVSWKANLDALCPLLRLLETVKVSLDLIDPPAFITLIKNLHTDRPTTTTATTRTFAFLSECRIQIVGAFEEQGPARAVHDSARQGRNSSSR